MLPLAYVKEDFIVELDRLPILQLGNTTVKILEVCVRVVTTAQVELLS